ncbi:RES family NAD+ phosphorylase, partial [Bacillus mycoides]|uniref:RES family NAD+ phosphorylase n=1 Tax=Bacillus mycoides TaxID=1405 RepID=UPI002E1B0D97|nr:RES family NAD+ phosphorylase [Bacillus mycoides]
LSAALESLKMPANQMSELSAALESLKMPANQMSELSAALESLKMPANQMSELSAALESLKMPANLNTNWILSKPVIKEMSLVNEEIDARKIFSKIPRAGYNLNQRYSNESNNLEYVLENKETKETIPVRDIPNAIAITDIIKDLTAEEVFDFFRHLVKFPMFGLQHPVGEKIFNEINKVSLRTFENLVLYRVRDRDVKKREMPFTDLEMFEAPYGLAGHGRFNVIGQGELYTCSSEQVALKEVASENQDYRYDIIKWELLQPISLLDLSGYDSPLVRYSSFEKTTSNKQEYLVPNFLSQCAKYHGITGIRYKSIVDNNELNYVFFDFEKRWFKTIDLLVNVQYKASELQVAT